MPFFTRGGGGGGGNKVLFFTGATRCPSLQEDYSGFPFHRGRERGVWAGQAWPTWPDTFKSSTLWPMFSDVCKNYNQVYFQCCPFSYSS